VEEATLGEGVDDLDEHLADIGGQYHEPCHYHYRIELFKSKVTASQGFLANGPGAIELKVPVENCWA